MSYKTVEHWLSQQLAAWKMPDPPGGIHYQSVQLRSRTRLWESGIETTKQCREILDELINQNSISKVPLVAYTTQKQVLLDIIHDMIGRGIKIDEDEVIS